MREIYSSVESANQCADLHLHTYLSDGRLTPIEAVDVARELGICVIGLTDHNDSHLALSHLAQRYGKTQDVEVIPGCEVTTRVGHVVGLYLRSPISPQQPLDYTIEAIHDQGGLVIAVHPLALRVKGIGIEAITSVINHPSPDVYFDGFEVYNAGLDIYPPLRDKNAEALALYQELLIDYADKIGAAVGSSDSHFYPIGAGRTWYNGDLREALARRETIVTSGYTGGKFEGLNAAYREFGPKAFDRYWELKKRNL